MLEDDAGELRRAADQRLAGQVLEDRRRGGSPAGEVADQQGGGQRTAGEEQLALDLQRLADDLGFVLHVRHFPPGTSKWNKIEHRMFVTSPRIGVVNLFSAEWPLWS